MLFVDQVLRIIGWDDKEIYPEEQAGSARFTDYLLKVDDAPRVIVEARPEARTFQGAKQQLTLTSLEPFHIRSSLHSWIGATKHDSGRITPLSQE